MRKRQTIGGVEVLETSPSREPKLCRAKLDIIKREIMNFASEGNTAVLELSVNRPEFTGINIRTVDDVIDLVNRFVLYQVNRFNLPESVFEGSLVKIENNITALAGASFYFEWGREGDFLRCRLGFKFQFLSGVSSNEYIEFVLARRDWDA